MLSGSDAKVLPAQDSEDEIEHEEGADDDEGDEEDPVEGAPDGIVGLKRIEKFVDAPESTLKAKIHIFVGSSDYKIIRLYLFYTSLICLLENVLFVLEFYLILWYTFHCTYFAHLL